AVARARPCEGTTVASVPYAEPSLVFLLGTETKLTDIRGATEHLRGDPACALALVGSRERSQFLSLMAAASVPPREADAIRGITSSNGKRLDLTLYAPSPAGSPHLSRSRQRRPTVAERQPSSRRRAPAPRGSPAMQSLFDAAAAYVGAIGPREAV